MIRRHSRVVLALLGASLSGLLGAATLDDERLRAELDNLRALPFGYGAVCERGKLEVRGPRSAVFVVRESRLCALWGVALDTRGTGVFVLCSTDPENVASERADGDRVTVTRCRELDLSTFEAL